MPFIGIRGQRDYGQREVWRDYQDDRSRQSGWYVLAGRISELVTAMDISREVLEYARISAGNIARKVSGAIPFLLPTRPLMQCSHAMSSNIQLEVFRVHTFPVVNLAFSRAARTTYATFLRVSSVRAAVRRALIGAEVANHICAEFPARWTVYFRIWPILDSPTLVSRLLGFEAGREFIVVPPGAKPDALAVRRRLSDDDSRLPAAWCKSTSNQCSMRREARVQYF
jgi:hypothetical protein